MNDSKKTLISQAVLKVNWIGILVNILLGVLKIAVGFFAGSMALLADGIHSFSDLMTDFTVVAGTKLASRAPDKKHPYGHEWYESLTSAFISLVLVLLGCGMIYKGALSIARQEVAEYDTFVVVVAFVSILTKEWLFRKTRTVAKTTHSPSLNANAWHHRSDALSSVAVLFGVLSLKFGFEYGDQFATAAVGLMLIMAGGKGFERCLREFADTSVDDETMQAIREVIDRNSHVRQWHKLRTRTVGREVFLDFHILVDPEMSITLAHAVSEELEQNLDEKIDRPINIIIHVEPDSPELRK